MKLSNNMYAQLFSSAPIGFALNKMDGTFVEFNEKLLSITGYTRDEFSKLSYWDLTPKEYEEEEAKQLASLQSTESYGPYEKEYYHAKGYRIDVVLQGILVENESGEEFIFSTVQDISDTKKAEKVLNKAQELGNIGHWYLDLITNNLTWSDETYRIFGLQPQEFDATYEAFVERIYPDDRDAVNGAYTNSLEVDEPYQIEHRVIRKNGEVRYVIERCEHFHSQDGKIIGSIGTVLDITERKLNENALLEAKNKAESSSLAKSSFIASMNHELRTPLNAILGFSNQMSRDESLSQKYQKYLGIINNSGKHLLGMINDILDISKIEAGEMKVENSTFNLFEMVDSITDLMSFEAKSKKLQCKYNKDEDVPKYIVSDSGKIKQVLFNIIGNAIKFTNEGTVIISISAQKIKNRDNFRVINIEVSDTGCGIEELMLDEIFKPFVQNDGFKKVEGGTGLGLSISKNILDLLGGEIVVESKVGEGTTFSILFPVKLAEESDISMLLKEESTKNVEKELEIVPESIDDEEIEKLPIEIVHAILDSAQKGSGLKIKVELEKIENTHENAYKYLLNLVNKYDFDSIIELLERTYE